MAGSCAVVDDMATDMLRRPVDGNRLAGWRFMLVSLERSKLIPFELSMSIHLVSCETCLEALTAAKADNLHHDQERENDPSILAMAVASHGRLPQRQNE